MMTTSEHAWWVYQRRELENGGFGSWGVLTTTPDREQDLSLEEALDLVRTQAIANGYTSQYMIAPKPPGAR